MGKIRKKQKAKNQLHELGWINFYFLFFSYFSQCQAWTAFVSLLIEVVRQGKLYDPKVAFCKTLDFEKLKFSEE